MKTLKYLFTLLLVSITLTGCGFDDREDFLGTWESYIYCDGYDEYELYPDERVTYTFYEDRMGYYTQGNLSIPFEWYKEGRNHLILRYSDGLTEDFFYQFDGPDMIGEYRELFEELAAEGFSRARVDGE